MAAVRDECSWRADMLQAADMHRQNNLQWQGVWQTSVYEIVSGVSVLGRRRLLEPLIVRSCAYHCRAMRCLPANSGCEPALSARVAPFVMVLRRARHRG